MDGRGRAFDNIFVERLWRTVKYEDVYVKGYASLGELTLGLSAYFSPRSCRILRVYSKPDQTGHAFSASGDGAAVSELRLFENVF